MITTFSTRCPNLQRITLHCLPRSSVIIVAISEMLLTCNRITLQNFDIDSSLTEPAHKVIFRLPNLCMLRLALEGRTLLPPVVLPDFIRVYILYPNGHKWLRSFYRVTLDKLMFVSFHATSTYVGDFLEAFEGVVLSTSISATLSTFKFYSLHPWTPTYSSLLAFKQLTTLTIVNPCQVHCSSTVDDDILVNLV